MFIFPERENKGNLFIPIKRSEGGGGVTAPRGTVFNLN